MHNDFEDVMHLLIWGYLPSTQEKQQMEITIADYASPPANVRAVISAFPSVTRINEIIQQGYFVKTNIV